jgi:regulatory protein
MPEITGLHEVSASAVLVELDGAPWRKIPLTAAARAGLSLGKRLEREDLRLLGRELRRAEALTKATRMLARRPLSRALLEERLEKKGVAPVAREEAVEALEQAQYLNDRSYALERARSLAERSYGDAAVRYILEQERVGSELIEEAISSLEPEVERARALLAAAADRRRTLRRLVTRGFSAETLEDLGESEGFG